MKTKSLLYLCLFGLLISTCSRETDTETENPTTPTNTDNASSTPHTAQALQEQLNGIKAQVKNNTHTLDRLTTLLPTLQSDIETLTQQFTCSVFSEAEQEKITNLKASVEALGVPKITLTFTAFAQELGQLEAEIQRLKDHANPAEIQEELTRVKQRLDEIAKQIAKDELAIASFNESLTTLPKEVDRLQNRIEAQSIILGNEFVLASAKGELPRVSELTPCVDINFSVADREDETYDLVQGLTALSAAVSLRKSHVVKYLIDQGADVNARNAVGRRPITYISYFDSGLSTLKELVENGAYVDERDGGGNTLLHKTRYTEQVKYLVDQGADVNAQSFYWGRVPLHSWRKSAESIKYLIDHGASVNVYDRRDGHTPLTMAAYGAGRFGSITEERQEEWLNKFKFLVEDGSANVNASNDDGQTSLDILSGARYPEATQFIKYLVDQGAQVNTDTDGVGTLLHSACDKGGHLEILKYLIETLSIDVNLKNRTGETALHHLDGISSTTWLSRFKYLIETAHADPDLQDNLGNTLLHRIARFSQSSATAGIKSVVEVGKVDVNLKNNLGNTPLHIMASSIRSDARLKQMKYLVSQGADHTIRNEAGKTALDIVRESANASDPQAVAVINYLSGL